jgi:penicillin-binding protein 2
MPKRICILFFLFALCVGLLGLRLLRIPLALPAQSARAGASVTVDRSRGAIYDRNGRRLVQADRLAYVAAKPTPAASLALRGALSQARWLAVEERMARGSLVALPVEGPVPPCGDLQLLDIYPRYGARQRAAHVVGYLDGQSGAGVSGIEKAFDDLLGRAAGQISVRMAADVDGRGLAGAALEILDENYHSRAGVRLTLDARVQAIVEEAMELGGVEQGAAVVMDCATGEILALASAPAFDPGDLAPSLHDPREPFFNRALGAYPVGSIFKCFVAAAALEQRISASTRFTCEGELDVGGQVFRCGNGQTHGSLDMPQALAQSCNLYFIQLGQRLLQQPLLDLMRLFGFGEPAALARGIVCAGGNLPAPGELALPGELANFAFGQGKLLGAPLQICAATACLANGGVYHSPTLVQATVDENGAAAPWFQDTETRQVISPAIAAQLRAMMALTVEEGTGRSARPETGGAGGKTATAQTGRYGPGGAEILQTGFTGFFPAENPRYAVTVFRQNGVSGASDCGPVFKRIADAMNAQGIG